MPEPRELILLVLDDIEPLMKEAFAAVGGTPEPGSPLDQVFLADGGKVVAEYLDHGETALAFDHLLYMIIEPPIPITENTYSRLVEAGHALGLPDSRWETIRRDGGAREQ